MIFVEIYYSITETEIQLAFIISDHTTWNDIIDQPWIITNETSIDFIEDPTTFFINNPNLLEDIMQIVDSIHNSYTGLGSRDIYIDINNTDHTYDDTDWYLSD